jgi:hypothetical protein
MPHHHSAVISKAADAVHFNSAVISENADVTRLHSAIVSKAAGVARYHSTVTSKTPTLPSITRLQPLKHVAISHPIVIPEAVTWFQGIRLLPLKRRHHQ